jgi:hypothetical protein
MRTLRHTTSHHEKHFYANLNTLDMVAQRLSKSPFLKAKVVQT